MFFDLAHVATALVHDKDIDQIHSTDGHFKRILSAANTCRFVSPIPDIPLPKSRTAALEQMGQGRLELPTIEEDDGT